MASRIFDSSIEVLLLRPLLPLLSFVYKSIQSGDARARFFDTLADEEPSGVERFLGA
jgi:hypothetical protein